MSELKSRWLSDQGRELLDQVVRCLERGGHLSAVKGLGKNCGRWDLRGATLSALEKETKVEAGGHRVVLRTGSLRLANCSFNSIDFSYADISYSSWQRVRLDNCLFEGTVAREWMIRACDFSNCVFRRASLFNSRMNRNIGPNSGSFKYVEFIDTNLSQCAFYFPVIENCTFVGCNLEETDFDGSRFRDCRFVGDMNGVWFRGYSRHARTSVLGLFRRVNPREFRNRMDNVDFSGARLLDVSFIQGIDLARCRFPDDGNYIFVKDIHKTFARVKAEVSSTWEGEHRRIALGAIDEIFLSPLKSEQSNDLVEKHILTDDGRDVDFGERFFDLIRRHNR